MSAQKVGIDGGGFVEGIHLKLLAPERYAELEHPGDAWSFDIFTQVGALLQLPSDDNPLVGLKPSQILAAGESQSAACLVTYINAIDPHAELFDGFFVHGRPASGVSIDGVFIPRRHGWAWRRRAVAISSTGERIRDDARVPVLVLQSETDVVLLGGQLAEQPDSDIIRTWEIAGAAHADTYTVGAGRHDDGTLTAQRMAELLRPTSNLMIGRHGLAHQRRPAAALCGPGWPGAPRPVGGGRRGSPFGSVARAQQRPDGLRPRRARHRQGWDPHAVGGRAGGGHGWPRADRRDLRHVVRPHRAVRRRHPGHALPRRGGRVSRPFRRPPWTPPSRPASCWRRTASRSWPWRHTRIPCCSPTGDVRQRGIRHALSAWLGCTSPCVPSGLSRLN